MTRPYIIIHLFTERFMLTHSHVETKPNNYDAKNCLIVVFVSFLKFSSLFLKLFEYLNNLFS